MQTVGNPMAAQLIDIPTDTEQYSTENGSFC